MAEQSQIAIDLHDDDKTGKFSVAITLRQGDNGMAVTLDPQSARLVARKMVRYADLIEGVKSNEVG